MNLFYSYEVGFLAIIIPEKISDTISIGVQRALLGMRKLPDTYLIYYEPLLDSQRPDIIIISPELGLLIVEIRTWYPGTITGVSDEEIQIHDDCQRSEIHPFLHAQDYLKIISRESRKHPVFSSLLIQANNRDEFCFPTGYLLLLPNCTISQLSAHHLCDLHSFFNPEHTICREMLKEMERWDADDLIPFLRSCTSSAKNPPHLNDDQIRYIRGVIHPEIVLSHKKIQNSTLKPGDNRESLLILDYDQEKHVYQLKQGHQIIYGAAGSGKTTILKVRAKILHNHTDFSRILILCNNNVLSEQLQSEFSEYSRIKIYSFDNWAYIQGITRKNADKIGESDNEFGDRLYQHLHLCAGDYQAYDAVLIDEGQDFTASWIRCAREALKDPEHGDLLIVSDGNQNRNGPGDTSWKELGVHAYGHISHHELDLKHNYRNTKEIQNLARLFLYTDENAGKEREELEHLLSLKGRSGLKPLLVWNTSHIHQGEYATYLVQRLLGSLKSVKYFPGMKPDDIGILYPCADEQDKIIIYRMVSELGRFCPVQWVAENNDSYTRIHLPGVKVHDINSVKGMQYRAVLVLFSEYYDRFFKVNNLQTDRNLLYVTLTRPLDFLTMQYTEKTDSIKKILTSGDVDQFIGK